MDQLALPCDASFRAKTIDVNRSRRTYHRRIFVPRKHLLKNPNRAEGTPIPGYALLCSQHNAARPYSALFWRFPEHFWALYERHMRDSYSAVRCSLCDQISCWRVLPNVTLHPLFIPDTWPTIEHFAKRYAVRFLALIVRMATSDLLVERCRCHACSLARDRAIAISPDPSELGFAQAPPYDEPEYANDDEGPPRREEWKATTSEEFLLQTGIGWPGVSPVFDSSNEIRLRRAVQDLRLWHTVNIGFVLTRMVLERYVDVSCVEREAESAFEHLMDMGCAALALPLGTTVSQHVVTRAVYEFVSRHRAADGGVCMGLATSVQTRLSVHALAMVRGIPIPCDAVRHDFEWSTVRNRVANAQRTFVLQMSNDDDSESPPDDSDSGYSCHGDAREDPRWLDVFYQCGVRGDNFSNFHCARLKYLHCSGEYVETVCDELYREQFLYAPDSFILQRNEEARHLNPCIATERAVRAAATVPAVTRRRERGRYRV